MIQEISSLYKYKIILVGCGNMGKPILQALLSSKLDIEIYIIDPQCNKAEFTNFNNAIFISNLTDLPNDFKANIILFATKPQTIAQIAPEYKNIINNDSIIISILAGIRADFFTKIFTNETQIVRLMPNLGAKFNKSMSFIYSPNLRVKKTIIEDLVTSFGNYIWLDQEEKMHQATAVCGSGPAYYLLFFKYFSEFLVKNNFSKQEAHKITLHTCDAALALANHDQDLDNLIKQVTSPNGTTQAALEEFTKDDQLQKIFTNALEAATQRSKELSGA